MAVRCDVAVEACTGWLFVCEALVAAGAVPHLAEPVETRALRGRKRRAKTDREDARWLRELLADGWGALPQCSQTWPTASVERPPVCASMTPWSRAIEERGLDASRSRSRPRRAPCIR